MAKNIMINILNDIDQYSELSLFFNSLTDAQKKRFTDAINNMNREVLFKSPIHGEYHSEKVTLFAYLLGIQLGCTDKELEMLLDAGRYHDFMRERDVDDSLHGFSSAINIEQVIDVSKYTQQELAMLKVMIDYHSVASKQKYFDNSIFYFELEPEYFDKCFKLANILKDADALDRKRFSNDSVAALNPSYLYFPNSLRMVKLAEEVNNAYLPRMFTDEEILANPYLFKENGDCFHSIGKNLFRLNSVLKHGILSYSKICKVDPNFTRNFDGGNSDKWVSVVSKALLDSESGASKEFLKNGLVFAFSNVEMYYPHEAVNSSYAKSFGLPYRKGEGYSDERYAFLEIPMDKLAGLSINKGLANTDLKDLSNYVFNSYAFSLFERNVKFYLSSMGLLVNGDYPDDLKADIKEYEQIDAIVERVYKSGNFQETDKYAEQLQIICSRINKKLARYIHNYYAKLLGRDSSEKVTFKDAVEYELSKSRFDYTVSEDENGNTIFVLTPREDIIQNQAQSGIKR